MSETHFKILYIMLAIVIAIQIGIVTYIVNERPQIVTTEHIKYAQHDTVTTTVTEYK